MSTSYAPEHALLVLKKTVERNGARVLSFKVTADQVDKFYVSLVRRGLEEYAAPDSIPAFRRKDYLMESIREGRFHIYGITLKLVGEKP